MKPWVGNYRHGHAGVGRHSSVYKCWLQMRRRCNDTTAVNYERYGARGIRVCSRWESFPNFLADMGEKPVGKTLDRKDNDGNYTPENCKWSTPSEQSLNRRKRSATTEETKRKLSDAMRGRPSALKGRPWSLNRRLAQQRGDVA